MALSSLSPSGIKTKLGRESPRAAGMGGGGRAAPGPGSLEIPGMEQPGTVQSG